MPVRQELKDRFERLELVTVSDSFGGKSVIGKAPVFAFKPIIVWFGGQSDRLPGPLSADLDLLKRTMDGPSFKYTLECLGRFAFCIELTNLGITSTKMKTRWMSGLITKTRPGTFENYEGEFAPGDDERAASFDECFLILCKCISLLANSDRHIALMKNFRSAAKRGTPYESVFTYINPEANPVHAEGNVRLVNLPDPEWLVKARPIIQPVMRFDANGNRTKVVEKIATKCYKTDRSQTGEVQTNRAKRWECLAVDFQRASLEDCWSVERKLLNDVAHFVGFPAAPRQVLIDTGLFQDDQVTLCPITLQPMVFSELLGGGGHGESKFQVGHMMPLKAGGHHLGENIEWISSDGNRIQGSLNIQETRLLLQGIFTRMTDAGLLP